MDHPWVLLGPYAIHLIHETSIMAHISLLHIAMVAHMQVPFSEFHNVLARTHRLLWSLPLTTLRDEFRLWYHDFMVMGDVWVMGRGFTFYGVDYSYQRALMERGIRIEEYFLRPVLALLLCTWHTSPYCTDSTSPYPRTPHNHHLSSCCLLIAG